MLIHKFRYRIKIITSLLEKESAKASMAELVAYTINSPEPEHSFLFATWRFAADGEEEEQNQ